MTSHSKIEVSERFGEKLRELVEQFTYLPKALRLMWAAVGTWMVAWFVLLLIQGGLPGLSVYLVKLVLDGAEAAIGGGVTWENTKLILIPAGLMAGVLLLTNSLTGVKEWVQAKQSELLQDHIQGLVQEKAVAVDLSFYDSSDYYDHLHKASSQADGRMLELLGSIGNFIQNSVTLVTIAGLLVPYGIWIPLALVMSTFPALYVVVKHNRRHHHWWDQTAQDRRKVRYYNQVLTESVPAKEVRLFDLGDHFKTAYQLLRGRLRGERLQLVKEQAMARFGASVSALLVTGGVMGWMIWRALQGVASIGDLGLFYQAFNRGQGISRTVLNSLGNMYNSVLFLEHLFEFLQIEPEISSPSTPKAVPSTLTQGIRFRDVTFHYPEVETLVLENFNFTIPAGKVVALVGANGAGKSTLIKLLCRFYDPQAGAIEIDGVDLRDFDPVELRRHISVLFQFPIRYQASAAFNIEVGDLEAEKDRQRLKEAAQSAMIHERLEQLPRGYDTPLGKWFDHGTDLSGGQWQRLTLARAFYREAPMVILDEPTSAMDSWAENEWMGRFKKLVEGRTAVIITHRFTTAMRADVIHVMEQGQIVESGTHEELLRQDGRYVQSWTEQMRASEAPSSGVNGHVSNEQVEMN